jgi:hypothetical protein
MLGPARDEVLAGVGARSSSHLSAGAALLHLQHLWADIALARPRGVGAPLESVSDIGHLPFHTAMAGEEHRCFPRRARRIELSPQPSRRRKR